MKSDTLFVVYVSDDHGLEKILLRLFYFYEDALMYRTNLEETPRGQCSKYTTNVYSIEEVKVY